MGQSSAYFGRVISRARFALARFLALTPRPAYECAAPQGPDSRDNRPASLTVSIHVTEANEAPLTTYAHPLTLHDLTVHVAMTERVCGL